jgi:DNA-directed RNA polymerase specialized sigma24 family protein
VTVRARSDAARRRALEQSRARPESDALAQAPDRLVVRDEQCAAMDEEIARLPAPQRRVIVLVDLEGETQISVGRMLK